MHGGAHPHHGTVEAALASMTALRERDPLAAWKIYTMATTDAHV